MTEHDANVEFMNWLQDYKAKHEPLTLDDLKEPDRRQKNQELYEAAAPLLAKLSAENRKKAEQEIEALFKRL